MGNLSDLRDKTAIVGVGNTNFGSLYRNLDPARSSYDLGMEALKAAMDDAGLTKNDIDGVLVSRIPDYTKFCDMLGRHHINYATILPGGGRYSGMALQYAVMLVTSGLANVVACVYGNNGRSVGATYGGEREQSGSFDTLFGFTSPGASWAMMWRRYCHYYGIKDPDRLGAVAVSNRKHASTNPSAVMREPFSLEEYRAARWIAEPLRLYDYCLINDGGVAFIVTSSERARDLRKAPVYISGTATSTSLTDHFIQDDGFETGMRSIADKLYPAAGIDRKDVDCLQIYDHFSPAVPFALEYFGYAHRGEGLDFVQDGRITIGGELPINTSGGHLSESYMQGWAMHVEAVRQLRGERGEAQVANCEVVQYISMAHIASSHILRR
jgi:acetyl-CoA acetyltransferase